MEEILRKLHACVADIMNINTDNKKSIQLQSIASMVYTLIQDGKAEQLDAVLNFHFPQYYSSIPQLFHSDN